MATSTQSRVGVTERPEPCSASWVCLADSDARSARFARTLAPFVGRHHELAVLGDLASRVRAGKGQAVSIVGEPGIGKSRLLHECTQHVAAPAGMAVLEGRCVSYGSNIPYLPLADFIRTHCGVRESDPPEHMRLAVERTSRDHDLPSESGTWLLRVIGGIDTSSALGGPQPGSGQGAHVRRTPHPVLQSRQTDSAPHRRRRHPLDRSDVRRVSGDARRAACRRADHDRHDVSSRLSRSVARSIVPHAHFAPPADRRGQRAARRVPSHGEQPLPEAVSAAIVEKGEGNPFFLEELARTVG